MDYQEIVYERIGPVARIWHNRPGMRNAENTRLLEELNTALQQAQRDDEVRVIVLAGKGDHFSAGHDLKEGKELRSGYGVEERWKYEDQYYFEYCLNILNCHKPTIAQVQGACIAGGFMVANMCDLMIASDDAFFADPVVHTMAVAAVEVLIHPWVLGGRKAKEMLFTGQRITAAEALAAGMANRVVPRAELDDAVMAMADKVAEAPPFALKLIKKSLNRTMDIMGRENALRSHFDSHQLSHFSDEAIAMKKSGATHSIRRDASGKAANV
ncbi:enoyl-CoA hydratase [Alcaligenaceae bacterium]|nr:enoyl-CoA hydratase [Alcaligenaceae bacterium]